MKIDRDILANRARLSLQGKAVIGVVGGLLLLIVLGVRTCSNSIGYNFDMEDHWQYVLDYNNPDSTYTYYEQDEGFHHLHYMGVLDIGKEKIKVLTHAFITNRQRGISRIHLFTYNNKYLGNYKLEMIDELPVSIESNGLVFKKDGDSCNVLINEPLPKILHVDCLGSDFPYKAE